MIKNIAAIFISSAFVMVAKPQSAETIISKYLAHTGGVSAWKNIRTITSSGTYNYGGIEFPFVAWSKAPDMYKYEVTANGKSFTQAYDGKSGWRIDGFKNETQKTILAGRQATAMANEADVELAGPFIDYKNKGNSILFEGKDTAGKILCYKIQLSRKSGDTETYYFSTGNYELVKKQAISKNSEMDNSMMDIWYSDYHTTDGITTPQKISCISKGQTILVITVTTIKLNLPIDDSIFKP